MKMDLTLLRTFIAVVDAGSVSGAALSLNCVQSNVTARIKRLEAQFGQRFLIRGRGGAELTPFGHSAHERIIRLLEHADALQRDLLEGGEHRLPLRLGAMETTAASRLPKLFKMLKTEYPDTKISLKTGPTALLLDLVWQRKLDAAFVSGPVDEDRFAATLAFKEELIVLSPSSETLPNTLFAFPVGCSYRAMAEAWLRDLGLADTQVSEMGSFDAMIGCAAAGMGFLVAPKHAANHVKGASDMIQSPLPPEFGVAKTFLIARHDATMPTALTAVLNILRSSWASESSRP